MTTISKCITVPYKASELFQLVNDIDSYPQFLPFCTDAKVLHRADDQLIASISLAVGKLNQSFTTRNTMQADRKIQMKLVKGPFKWLDGCWEFQAISQQACSVILKVNFEFKNKILKRMLEGVFNKVMHAMVGAFAERARQVYGRRMLK